jgi:hypothetical protein
MCKGFEQGRTPRKCREARREGKGGEGYAWVFKNKEAGQRPLSLSLEGTSLGRELATISCYGRRNWVLLHRICCIFRLS